MPCRIRVDGARARFVTDSNPTRVSTVKSNLRHGDSILRLFEILQLSLTKPSNQFNQGGCDEEINVVYGSGIFGAARYGPRSIA